MSALNLPISDALVPSSCCYSHSGAYIAVSFCYKPVPKGVSPSGTIAKTPNPTSQPVQSPPNFIIVRADDLTIAVFDDIGMGGVRGHGTTHVQFSPNDEVLVLGGVGYFELCSVEVWDQFKQNDVEDGKEAGEPVATRVTPGVLVPPPPPLTVQQNARGEEVQDGGLAQVAEAGDEAAAPRLDAVLRVSRLKKLFFGEAIIIGGCALLLLGYGPFTHCDPTDPTDPTDACTHSLTHLTSPHL